MVKKLSNDLKIFTASPLPAVPAREDFSALEAAQEARAGAGQGPKSAAEQES